MGFGGAGASVRQEYANLCQRPLKSISQIKAACGLSFSTTSKPTEILVALGIVRELTLGRRNRLFPNDAYLTILSEGTEPF